jgi:hypothetical protein
MPSSAASYYSQRPGSTKHVHEAYQSFHFLTLERNEVDQVRQEDIVFCAFVCNFEKQGAHYSRSDTTIP